MSVITDEDLAREIASKFGIPREHQFEIAEAAAELGIQRERADILALAHRCAKMLPRHGYGQRAIEGLIERIERLDHHGELPPLTEAMTNQLASRIREEPGR